MNTIDIPIVGPSYNLQDWSVDCQRTVNLFPQAVESGNTNKVSALLPTPGLVELFNLGGVIRGMYALNTRLLVVSNNMLYSIRGSVVTQLGEVSGVGRVYFADNSVDVMIVSNNAYALNIKANLLTKITSAEFLGASDLTILDSRFIWSIPNSRKIQWSDLLSTQTSALYYATKESKSDNLVRVIANSGQLWLIGELSTEIWGVTGSADAPFQRMSGAVLPLGCLAKDSICIFGSSLVWLSQSEHGKGQIVMTQGYQTQRISNHAIESAINSYADVTDAYSFAYQENGHSFLVMSFPTAKKTWCYDAVTGLWHERSYYNSKTALHEHHRAGMYCFFEGKHIVGDRNNGKIYELTEESFTDAGDVIVRERITPVLNPQGQRLIFDELEIFCQTGQLTNIEPNVILDWSDDKGQNWAYSRQVSLGKIGEFNKRVIFRRLGQSFNRVFRIRFSDVCRFVVTGSKVKVR